MAFVAEDQLVRDTDRAASGWAQGDIVDLSAAFWLALPESPLTQHAAEATQVQDSDVSVVVASVETLVVISQTCDIVRTCAARPHVELARLVRLEEPAAGEARRGTRPRFVPVPGAGQNAFADLDLIVTVEKSLLLRSTRQEGLATERDRRRFAQGVGRVFSRFAFPDDLSTALRPLVARIRHKHERASDEGKALSGLEEIRVTGSPDWGSRAIDVFLTFAPSTRSEADALMSAGEWDDIVDGWLRRAEPLGVIRSVEGAMIPLDELTAREYLDSDPLDLDHLSWATA